jgi:RNA polymerase primary sigma factor
MEEAAVDPLDLFLRDVRRFPRLTHEGEIFEAKKLERGEFSYKDSLINAHLPLVISIAKRYRNQGLDFMELIQEGSMGLGRAVEMYDYRRGLRVSTYATWKIHGAIQRAIAEKGRLIRLPVHAVARVKRIDRAQQTLRERLGRQPTTEEIADEMGIAPKEVDAIRGWAWECSSLEAANDGGEADLHELIADQSLASPFEVAAGSSTKRAVQEALAYLTHRERRVIELRYGLDGAQPETLERIGRRLNVTRERIRQIEGQALEKLKSVAAGCGLREALG